MITQKVELLNLVKQGRIHGIRCYETRFSAAEEKALRTNGPTARRTDGQTDGWTHPLIEMRRRI